MPLQSPPSGLPPKIYLALARPSIDKLPIRVLTCLAGLCAGLSLASYFGIRLSMLTQGSSNELASPPEYWGFVAGLIALLALTLRLGWALKRRRSGAGSAQFSSILLGVDGRCWSIHEPNAPRPITLYFAWRNHSQVRLVTSNEAGSTEHWRFYRTRLDPPQWKRLCRWLTWLDNGFVMNPPES